MLFREMNVAIQEEMQLDPGLNVDAERVRYINEGMQSIGLMQLVETKTTQLLVNVADVTTPTGLTELISLRWNGVALSSAQLSETLDGRTGTPSKFVYEGNGYRLYPAPDVAGTLVWVYTYIPTSCALADFASNATTAPNLPLEWHAALVDYSCGRAYRKNGNIVMSMQYMRDFNLKVSALAGVYLSKRNSKKVLVRDSQQEDDGGDW